MESRSLKSRSGAYAINVVKQIAWAGVYVIIALLIFSGQARAWGLDDLICPTYARINTSFSCTGTVSSLNYWSCADWSGPSSGAQTFFAGYSVDTVTMTASHNTAGPLVNQMSNFRYGAKKVFSNNITGCSATVNGNISSPKNRTTHIIPTQPITSVGCPTTVIVGTPFTCTPAYSYDAPNGTSQWTSTGLTAVTNSPGKFTATAAGTKTVTLTKTWGTLTNTLTQTITASVPAPTISSLGCPASAITSVPTTCSPVVTGGDPLITYAFSGADTVSGNNLTFATPGTKTVTYTATYPGLGVVKTGTQVITVVTPTATITSLNCPAEVITGKSFACTPVVTSNVPGVVYTWSGDGVTATGNNLSMKYPGAYPVTLTATYPGYPTTLAANTQSVNVTTPSVTVTSLGCPTDVVLNRAFTCAPVFTTNLPSSFKTDETLTWTGPSGILVNGNNLTLSAGGKRTVNLVVSYPNAGGSGTNTQTVNVISPAVMISSVGCPAGAIVGKPVTCNPIFTANFPAEYQTDKNITWSGADVINGNNLTFTGEGSKTVTLNIKYPGVGGTGTSSQSVTAVIPAVTVSSLGCPSETLLNRAFTCAPVFTTNLPAEYKSDEKLVWTSMDMTATGNALTYSTGGTKNLTLAVSYPSANASGAKTGIVNIVTPVVTITSLGCPSDILLNRSFTCKPEFTSNLPEAFKTDEKLVWTSTDMAANGNTLTYSTAGAKDLRLSVSYPLIGATGAKTDSVSVTAPAATVASLGCPSNVATGRPFTCVPDVTANVTGVSYSWSASENMTAVNNSLTFNTPGTKTITYSGTFLDFGMIGSGTQTVNVITPEATVSSVGCPENQPAYTPFTCNPIVTSNIPDGDKTTALYTYSGTGLTINKDGTLQYNTAGTKSITVAVRYPTWEDISVTANQAIEIAPSSVTISSVGCPPSQTAFIPFTCTPAQTTNIPEAYQTGAQYIWSGVGLIKNNDNTMQFNGTGQKSINLTIKYPAVGAAGTLSQDIELTNADVAVTSLGCPEHVTALHAFTCTPVVSTGLPPEYQVGAQYIWSGDEGVQINNTSGSMVINTVGAKTVSLKVKYPAAAGASSGVQTQQVIGDAPGVQITGMNCPARVQANTPFKCSPKVSADLPVLMQGNPKHTYSGDGLQANQDGTLQFTTSGEKTIGVAVAYPMFEGAVGTSSQAMTIGETSLKIMSLGCPTTALTTKAVTCTPSVTTSIPVSFKPSAVYTWSGDGVQGNDDGTLTLTGEGVHTVTLSVSYPSFEASTTATQNISVTEPKLSITSLGCPADALAGQSFSCRPAVVANLPSAFLTGVKYVWSGDGLQINPNGSLQFTGDGSRTVTLTVNYPLANSTIDQSATMNIVTPSAEISSLGCPTSALINEKFSCKPSYTTNLPDSFKTNSRLVWTGEGLKVNAIDGSLTFSTSGAQKAISLAVVYPLAGNLQSAATGQMDIGSLDIAINSLGCPASVDSQVAFNCKPAITASLPAEMQGDIQYTWAGNTLNTSADGSLSMSGSGNIDLTLTAAVKGRDISVKRTEGINVRPASIGISSLGCPDRAVTQLPFSCTPVLATSLPPEKQSALQYSWEGEGLATDQDSNLTFAQAGTGKKVTLKVVDPNSGLKVERAGTMIIDALAVNITSIKCPSPLRQDTQFTCTPVVSTNLPNHLVSGMTYTWSGAGLMINGDGSFKFNNPGNQSVTLTVNEPKYNLTASKTMPISVGAAAVKIKSLGCPAYVTEYTPFTCNPVIATDTLTVSDAVRYEWKLNGNVVSTDKKLYINSPDANVAAAEVVLTASVSGAQSGEEIAKSVGLQTIKINANKTRLNLTVTAPKMAENGTQFTLSAATSFQTPSMVNYAWLINNKQYTGSSVQYTASVEEADTITYSVTAQPSCCSSIPAETKTGKITVATYQFPLITLTGPKPSIANIAPYKASFKLAVVNKINEAISYIWDFGDGTGGSAKTAAAVSHLYNSPGTYSVVLTATDSRGSSNQYTTDVTVGTLPERSVEIKGVMSNKYARAPISGYFKYNISGGLNSDSPISSLWSIDGQAIGNKAYVTQVFPYPGTYNLQLDVATRFGNSVSAVLPVTVNENQPPTCNITKKLIMAKQYQLYANCVDPDGKIVGYKWDLGNGATSQTINASARYTASGVYTISLTATDDSGTMVTVEDALSVD